MQARLKVLHDKANVKQVKLLPVTLIGRSTDCNLKIASSQVSRNHCRITLGEDTVFVEDLGSANGTLIDGQPLPAHQPTAIPPGAHLVVGPAEFLIDYVAPTSATMVLSRSGSSPAVDLPLTEMIFPASSTSTPSVVPVTASASPAATIPAVTPVAAVVPVVAPVVPTTVIAPVVIPTTAPPALTVATAEAVEPADFDSAATISEFSFAPAASSTESDEATMFAFGESSPAAEESITVSVDAAPKKGGLKSLFSLFGRKERSATTANAVEPLSPPSTVPSVFLPTVDSQAVDVAEAQAGPANVLVTEPEGQAAVATTEMTELKSSEAPETSTEEDDGFQQFLQQL